MTKTFSDYEEAATYYNAKFGHGSWELERRPCCEGTDILYRHETATHWVEVQGDHELYDPIRFYDDGEYATYKSVEIIQWKVVWGELGDRRDYDMEHFDTQDEAVRFYDQMGAKLTAQDSSLMTTKG
jgi:hypothetical protein